ncbi:MAG TPA: DAK2 domain-containing protein, partial [Marmoricola sp.]
MIDVEVLRRFADLATEALGAAREEIDALNVYPVPDGDTGTNMFLTMAAARDAIRELDSDELPVVLAAYSRGALLGARGNSGVILSQLVGALLRGLAEDRGISNAEAFAEGMRVAADAAYAAVGKPVEGTMLTVARAAAESAAAAAAGSPEHLADVVTAAADGARAALARTPEQLKTLRDAGVVDAGGRGLCVILDAADTALTGRRPVEATRQPIPQPLSG